jgi:protein gp37
MSKIEWTHRPGTKSEVLNPTTGCDKVSAGCRGCYAEVMHRRLKGMGQPKYQQPFLGHVKYWPDELAKPFKWKKPRTVFLNSMSDVFHENVTVQQIAEIYAMMFLTPKHTYIVLTKRSSRAMTVLRSDEFFEQYWAACNRLHSKYIDTLSESLYFEDELRTDFPLENVWQGVSVERQQEDMRIDHLALTPARIRVVSYEPAIGPLDLSDKFGLYQLEDGTWHLKVGSRWEGSPDWVIAGSESGDSARPAHPDWYRTIRDQCAAAGTAFFFKQWGQWAPGETGRLYREETTDWSDGQIMVKVGKHASGNFLDGVQHLEFPK